MELTLSLHKIIMVIFLGIVAYYDFRRLMIPNRLIIVGSIAGIILLFINKEHNFVEALKALLIVGGIAFGISYLSKGGLGMGDVKLLTSLGLYMDTWNLLNMVLISALLSGVVGLVLLVMGRVNKKTAMPFAPFVLISGMILIFSGQL